MTPESTDHDPDSWTTPYFLNLKTGYDILVNQYDCKVQEMYTVQDHPPSPNDSLLLPPLDILHKAHVRNQELSQPGDSHPVKPSCQRAISKQMMKKWEPWDTKTRKSNNSRMSQQLLSTRNKLLRQQVHKTLTHVPCPICKNQLVQQYLGSLKEPLNKTKEDHGSSTIMITRLSYLLKCKVNHRRGPYVGNLWDSSAIL
jgi:hypothetical protein